MRIRCNLRRRAGRSGLFLAKLVLHIDTNYHLPAADQTNAFTATSLSHEATFVTCTVCPEK